MTNEEVTSLLKDAQKFWSKWRDVPLQFHVHILGLEEILPGCVQVLLQL